MSKAYTKLYYHLVWATWKREPFLKPEVQENLYRYIGHKCKEYGYMLYAVNGMAEHVHVVIRLAPTVAVSKAAGKLKGSASRFCNDALDLETVFKWQAGYGALTFGKRDLPEVVAYVENQKTRHRMGTLNALLEQTAQG